MSRTVPLQLSALGIVMALAASGLSGADVTMPSLTLEEATVAQANLVGVTATSTSNAWAVGDTNAGQTLIMRWTKGATDAGHWAVQVSANPNTFDYLSAVSATSATNAWAVGYSQSNRSCSKCSRTLIEHWNGQRWSSVPSPNVSPSINGNLLTGVKAVSAGDVWAVGYSNNSSGGEQPVLEHWSGRAWSLVSGPSTQQTGGYTSYTGVAGTSSSNVWSVGAGDAAAHWNGRRWTQGGASGNQALNGVAMASPSDVWAVGLSFTPSGIRPFAQHRSRGFWQTTPTPSVGAGSFNGVAALAAGDVLAVGTVGTRTQSVLAERWNGSAWTRQDPKIGAGGLSAVTAIPGGGAWAVGGSSKGTLIEHWNGAAWRVMS